MSLLLHLLKFDVFAEIYRVYHYIEHEIVTILAKMVLWSIGLFTIDIQNEFYIDIVFELAFIRCKLSEVQIF